MEATDSSNGRSSGTYRYVQRKQIKKRMCQFTKELGRFLSRISPALQINSNLVAYCVIFLVMPAAIIGLVCNDPQPSKLAMGYHNHISSLAAYKL